MDVLLLPAWGDNYVYVVHDGATAAAVDPCDAECVAEALRTRGLRLTHILVTHHHADHTQGVAALKAAHGCEVVGPADDRIPGVSHAVADGDACMTAGGRFRTIATPGHTRSHVAYVEAEAGILFTGDVLFVAGCGRVSECTPETMWRSLVTLRSLPEQTRVYCGHNYTRENLEFAAHLEPGCVPVREALRELDAAEAAGRPFLPSSIGREKRINPFLKCDARDFHPAGVSRMLDPAARFAVIRKLKDRW